MRKRIMMKIKIVKNYNENKKLEDMETDILLKFILKQYDDEY